MHAAGLLIATEVDAEVGVPLALCPLAGRPALSHAVTSLLDVLPTVVVVGPSALADQLRPYGASVSLRPPGPDRHRSLHSGLSGVDGPHGMVVLHEISRPLVPAEVVARVLAAVRGGAALAVPATEMTETVKQVDAAGRVLRTVPRETLVRLQGPVAVRADLLRAAHAGCSAADPDGPLAPAGTEMSIVDGSELGFPVRGAAERGLAEALLARAEQVTGE